MNDLAPLRPATLQEVSAGDYLTQKHIHNPHASMPLIISVIVMKNTPELQIQAHVRENAARDLEWLSAVNAHDGVAVLVGGGPSAADCIDDIRALQQAGATVFALNAASLWLNRRGVVADYQVMVDAKAESAQMVDRDARAHLFGSQVHPSTMDAIEKPIVWHLGTDDVECLLPPERVKRGGYALIGGGAAVGNCAVCIAYALGFRTLHVFGYDSSNRNGATHAYGQAMNQFIPNVDVEWGGTTYTASVAMKAHAEWFQVIARDLLTLGCTIHVHGDGLLPAMYNTKPEDLAERDKYRLMWQFDGYRVVSPGEDSIEWYVSSVKPEGLIIDFGCGTGRASLALANAGHSVFLVDFADNCRDPEAAMLPFLEWDLSKPMNLRAPHGICADVMEHIPLEDVERVIANIMASAETVFFQISTVPDRCGALIGQPLHLTVKPHDWWLGLFTYMGYSVPLAERLDIASRFIVKR
jgi:uncharacterized Rossmann fold enzyme